METTGDCAWGEQRLWFVREAAKLLVVPVPAVAIRLVAPLACFALGLSGCFGGPTSDFPNRVNDDGAPTPPGDDTSGEGANSSGGGNDSGSTGSSGSNGGGSGQDAGSPPLSDADGGVPDGGPEAGIPDSGTSCGWQSLAPDVDHCSGNYCDVTRANLSASAASACAGTGSLDAVCAGHALSVVGDCFRTHVVSTMRAADVKACAKADLKLATTAEGCVDCYVALHECLGSSCAVECIPGVSPSCEACAATHCAAAFSTCSGLRLP